MEQTLPGMSTEGIDLDDCQHLFFVDVRGPFKPSAKRQRRAFVDLRAAVKFIGGRAATISAFISPLNESSDAAMYGLVQEAFESTRSQTYMLRFAGAPSVFLGCTPSTHRGEFEPFERIFPAAGADI